VIGGRRIDRIGFVTATRQKQEQKAGCYNGAMKTARTLLDSITSLHTFRPLSRHRCYRAFLEMLPARYRHGIAFITVKNRRLMVALSHPGLKMELNYNQELLKGLLRKLIEHSQECRFMEADEVVIFLSRFHRPSEENAAVSTLPRYTELAEGAFTIHTDNEALRETLERIRNAILRNRGEERA